MEFKFAIPTTIFFEKECVSKHGEVLARMGKKAMIVTGKHSAKACGALDDVIRELVKYEIGYVIFDEIENNPSVESVAKAADLAKVEGVDYVIGIGGGSPIDAAKAIAVLIANPEMEALDLFKNDFKKVAPIIGIPTTAGTGSEVTPYSVLLRRDMQTKLSFGNAKTIPSYAFLDAKYTKTLGKSSTISTAVDAFTHVLEGYLANRSTIMSDCLALEGIRRFGKSIRNLVKFELTQEDRENLLYVSLLGGMVITQTGVTIAHGMGYCYTCFKDIPHGKANGLIMREYLKLNSKIVGDKIEKVLEALKCKSIDEFADLLHEMLGDAPTLTGAEIEHYTQLTKLQKGSINNTPYPTDEEVISSLWKSIR